MKIIALLDVLSFAHITAGEKLCGLFCTINFILEWNS